MASTHRRTWQKAEARAATLFGATRQPGSGSGGNPGLTSSDSTHPSLYIESKLKAKHAIRTLFDDVRAKAKREGKTPILALFDKGRPGCLLVCDSRDLPAMIAAAEATITFPGGETIP